MTSALRASNIRVVDSAQPPTRPYKPSLVLNSALGLLAGAFFGFVFVVMRERADRSIQAPGEAALSLGVPELGVIPSLDAERSRFFAYYQKGRATKGVELKNNERSPQVELVTSQREPSVLADCFRATATSILYAGENGARPRIIALTSASPREGKTTVASNLALALAEIGWPVLLIDGDLRKGRLHEIFEVSNAWGLSDLLAGKEPPQGREKIFIGTRYQGLYLLPGGSPAPSISGLLHSPRTLEFLNHAREEFHTVIIDTPPMLQMPDARVLGRLADGVILVVRSAQTTRESAAAAAQRLMEDGTRVLGTILNEWDPRKASHSGYAYAYRHYHYEAKIS
jgi:capsular exopolysaccharide synthesis family protein